MKNKSKLYLKGGDGLLVKNGGMPELDRYETDDGYELSLFQVASDKWMVITEEVSSFPSLGLSGQGSFFSDTSSISSGE